LEFQDYIRRVVFFVIMAQDNLIYRNEKKDAVKKNENEKNVV